MSGILYIISSPSGAGKTSLINNLIKKIPDISLSISYTTRHMRPGEVNGQNYFFISNKKFINMLKHDTFIEYAKVFGNYYGTSKTWVKQKLAAGNQVIVEIDWKGARQVRKIIPKSQCKSIFILPPTKKELLNRLRHRNQDSINIIEKRMQEAVTEISHYIEYDYVVINDDFIQAIEDLKVILFSNKLSRKFQENNNVKLLQYLNEKDNYYGKSYC